MGGGGDNTQTQVTQLPSFAQPYAAQLLSAYANLAMPGGQPGPPPLPFSQVAPFTADQLKGMQGIEALGAQSPTANWAAQSLIPSLAGQYVNPQSNPWLSQYYAAEAAPMIQQYQTATAPDILTRAIQGGTPYSSGTAQAYSDARNTLGQNLANLATQTWVPMYQTERQNMLYGANIAPQTVAGQYVPAQAMMGIGGQQQEQMQNIYNTAYQNAFNTSMWPYQAMSNFANAIPGAIGGTGQTKLSGGSSGSVK
jgi:hypothetical protein